jgi:predicted Zn-dependent peptidase
MDYRGYIKRERESTRRIVLDSGAVVIVGEGGIPGVAAIGCFLRMGSLYEDDTEAGLSNLLQALMLKGTRRLDSFNLARQLDELGARTSSSSGRELGRISLLTLTDNLESTLELFLEIITQPLFSEEEFEKERQIAVEEIKRDRDQFLSRAFTLFQEAFYGTHPFHKHVLGYEKTVESSTLNDVKRFYEKFYVPSNLVYAVVGDVDIEKVLGIIDARTSLLAGREAPSAPAGVERIPSSDLLTEYRESEAAWIVVGFPAPSLPDPKHAACQVLAAVLGGSMNSRLFMELREKKALAYQVSATYNSYVGPSFIAGYIGTSPSRYEEAKSALEAEMMRIAWDGVSEEEVGRSINYLIGTHIISSEMISALMRRYGKFEALGVGYDFGSRYIEALTAVNTEGIRSLAAEFLRGPVTGAILSTELQK